MHRSPFVVFPDARKVSRIGSCVAGSELARHAGNNAPRVASNSENRVDEGRIGESGSSLAERRADAGGVVIIADEPDRFGTNNVVGNSACQLGAGDRAPPEGVGRSHGSGRKGLVGKDISIIINIEHAIDGTAADGDYAPDCDWGVAGVNARKGEGKVSGALVEDCKSRLPLDVADPSNWLISAWLAFANWMASVSTPADPQIRVADRQRECPLTG